MLRKLLNGEEEELEYHILIHLIAKINRIAINLDSHISLRITNILALNLHIAFLMD